MGRAPGVWGIPVARGLSQLTQMTQGALASATSLRERRSIAISHAERQEGCVTMGQNCVKTFINCVKRLNNRVTMGHCFGRKCGIWLENANSRTKSLQIVPARALLSEL